MKKTLTIGAASLALAAMPVVGAFAVDASGTTVTDTLEVKIAIACSFLRYGTAGASGQTDVTTGPNWNGTTTAGTADNDTTGSAHKYSASLLPGADVELGTSHFTAYCNAPSGFDVTVTTPDLENGSYSIDYSGTTISSGAGWTLTKDGTIFSNTSGAKFMTSSTATDANNAVTATATYNVYTDSTTAAGTYTGDVIYEFTYTDPTNP